MNRIFATTAILIIASTVLKSEQLFDLEPLVVRGDPRAAAIGISGDRPGDFSWLGPEMETRAFASWEALWRQQPAFDTFRRGDSRSAHPTTQGMRLRPLGTNAASRSLVLLDGLPLNDPFGGWVYTQHLPRTGWHNHTQASSGRAAAWGSPGFGGVLLLQRVDPAQITDSLTAGYGAQGSWSAEAASSISINPRSHLALHATWTEDPGFNLLRPEDRGPIDTRAGVDLFGGSARWAGSNLSGLEWETGWQGWQEERINGTRLSRNKTRAHDIWFRGQQSLANGQLHVAAFRQWRNFQNLFSSAAADRSSETPALEQFAVPAFSTGGSVIWEQVEGQLVRQQIGADIRESRATVRERYFLVDGELTRLREAGGIQRMSGVFWQPSLQAEGSNWEWNALLRLDNYRFSDGFRRESEPASGTGLRDEEYPNRSGQELSAFLEAAWSPSPETRLNATVHRGHRLPSLNELYRPYRVRNDIVEANPQLGPERAWGIDLGAWWQLHSRLRLSSQFWYQWLDQMVTNVLVVEGPSSDPLFGFVPAGGSGSQRQAVSGNRAYGTEWTLNGSMNDSIDWYLSAAWSQTRFGNSDTDPTLEGRPFPLSPSNNLRLGGVWNASNSIQLGAQGRWQSKADEDSGRGRLPAYSVIDTHLNWRIQQQLLLQIQVENVLNETVVTALSTDGLESIAAPRNLNIRLHYSF